MSVAHHPSRRSTSLPLLLLLLSSCQKPPPPDPLCTYEPLPASGKAEAGQGAIQIAAPTEDYFYVADSKGKEVGHAKANASVVVKPGAHQVRLNGSVHPAWVKRGELTRCACGALLVSGTTEEYYYVLDSSGSELSHSRLGGPLALFPGRYDVKLNGTTTSAEVAPGGTVEVRSGTLNVLGSTDEYYYTLSANGTELAHQKLGTPLAFFPGPLTVKVNGTTASAQVTAAAGAEVPTGALKVLGTTDEYYYVLSTTGTELAHQKLGQFRSFVAGEYTVRVNNTTVPAKVEPGKSNEVPTGSLVVTGSGSDYYYVLDSVSGNELAHAKVGQPLSLVAGTYTVKLAESTREATVIAGQAASLSL